MFVAGLQLDLVGCTGFCMSFSRFFAYSLVLPEWMRGHRVMEQFLWTFGFIAIASHGSEACIVGGGFWFC
jgi:hypothetical protein